MRYFYALAYLVLRAFGWCLTSFSILWLILHGYMSDLPIYFGSGLVLLAMSGLALEKAKKEV